MARAPLTNMQCRALKSGDKPLGDGQELFLVIEPEIARIHGPWPPLANGTIGRFSIARSPTAMTF
jgi:hypothetical protein